MDKNLISVLVAFAAGATVGALVMKKVLGAQYDEIVEREVASVKEAYERMSKRGQADERKNLAKAFDEAAASAKKLGESFARSSLDSGYSKARTAYHDLEKAGIMKRWSEDNGDAEDMSEEDQEDLDEELRDAAGWSEADHVNTHHERDLSNIDRTLPYIIDSEEYSNEFPHHDKLTIYYYELDDTLCDEQEGIIDDIDTTVGWDCFKVLEMQTTSWVRNEPMTTDFEILAIRGKYSETVAGSDEYAGLTPRERHERRRKGKFDDE